MSVEARVSVPFSMPDVPLKLLHFALEDHVSLFIHVHLLPELGLGVTLLCLCFLLLLFDVSTHFGLLAAS